VKRLLIAVVFAAMTLMSQPALAHKVIIDVYTDDTTVEGEIGFSNGDMAADTVVDVFDGEGKRLGVTKTNTDGVFFYKPTKAVTHEFRANMGAGHIATYVLEKEDLPSALLEGTDSKKASDSSEQQETTVKTMASEPSAVDVDNADLKSMISREVSHAIRPLQKELAAYKEKNDLQSILGGIGYILGLFGVASYMLSRRRDKKEG